MTKVAGPVSAAALLIAVTMTLGAGRRLDAEICRHYGFPPHSRAYSACLMNVWHYWSTGPCAQATFAAVHLRYCHELPPIDF